MGAAYEQAVRFFQNDGWLCRAEGEGALRTSCLGRNGEWACVIHTSETPPQFVMYSEFSLTVPGSRRAAVAEYLLRANQGMVVGNFELDLETGAVRYKTSVETQDAAQLGSLLRPLVYANVGTMDLYWPGLMAVLYQGAAPQVAVASVEANGSAQLR